MENVPKLREGCSEMKGAFRSRSEPCVLTGVRGYILIWSSDGGLTYMALRACYWSSLVRLCANVPRWDRKSDVKNRPPDLLFRLSG